MLIPVTPRGSATLFINTDRILSVFMPDGGGSQIVYHGAAGGIELDVEESPEKICEREAIAHLRARGTLEI